MTDNTLTRGARVNAEITALLRSRHTLLWVVSREEVRVERAIVAAAGAAKYETRFWDCATGTTENGVAPDGTASVVPVNADTDPVAAMNWLSNAPGRHVYVMRDLNRMLVDPVSLRTLRNIARSLQALPSDRAKAVVVLTTSAEVPPDLLGTATLIEYPLPDRAEVAALLSDVLSAQRPDVAAAAAPNGTREAAVDAALGLAAEQAANCFALSLVSTRRIDPAAVAREKKRVIAAERVLTWLDPDPRGLSAVGGLQPLKDWLAIRKRGFGEKARAFGLPAPKGMMLVGLPGSGKSLVAKCVATAWGLPLLRLDMGALRSKYVGDSEANIRKALALAETVAPCILWADEIEKALAGASGPSGDSGVSADALGTLLSWMQDRTGAVFVIATANDVRALPPELLRKGRFDEVFWLDLPTTAERAQILAATLAAHNRPTFGEADMATVAGATAGFSGAECAAIVPDALFAAFNDGARDLTVADLLRSAETVCPLAKTAAEKVQSLRDWAKGRARLASAPEAAPAATAGRSLDLD